MQKSSAQIDSTDKKNAIVEGKQDEKINMNDLTHEYKSWISELKTRYKQTQIKASVAVNGELLNFILTWVKTFLKNSLPTLMVRLFIKH